MAYDTQLKGNDTDFLLFKLQSLGGIFFPFFWGGGRGACFVLFSKKAEFENNDLFNIPKIK